LIWRFSHTRKAFGKILAASKADFHGPQRCLEFAQPRKDGGALMSVFLNLGEPGAVGGGPPDNNPHKNEQKPKGENEERPQEGQEKEVAKEVMTPQAEASDVKPEPVTDVPISTPQVEASDVKPESVKGVPVSTSQAEAPYAKPEPVKPEPVTDVPISTPPLPRAETRESSVPPAFTEGYRSTQEARHTMFEYEGETPLPPPHTHSTGPLWVVLILLVLAFAGALAYSYSALRGENISIAQLPAILRSVDSLGTRMDSAEAKVRDLTASWGQMSSRLTALDRKVDSTLRIAARNTHELETRLRSEMDQRNQAVDSRLNQMEQTQSADRASVARLNEKLETEITALQAQLNNARDENAHSLVNVNEQVGVERNGLRDLNQKLQRQKVTFEASSNSPDQIAPGVALTVLKTNAKHQRFRGYISLEDGKRKLWLDNLGVQESLELFPNDANHPYSLVITQINPHSVVGYLLLPAGV
jgi:hypothetical protein